MDNRGGVRLQNLRSGSVVFAAALWFMAMGLPLSSAAVEIGPDTDLCAALENLQPGEELVLLPGDYRSGCAIRRGGLPGVPTVIRASDPARRPRLLHPGRPTNMLEVRANDVVIRSLDFSPGLAEADGVRIITGNRITVEDCHFIQMGGIAIVANHWSVQGLTVRRNVISDTNATGMYFGCHDGVGCTVSGLRVEENYIHGVTAPSPEIGYGIQVKLNSSGVIRDNMIVDTKGPGIMVYGSRNLVATSVVERNFTRGSRTSSGIVVGGGPVLLRNNISMGNFDAGIGLENYGRRGLLRRIVVAHNTVFGNRQSGISVPDQGPVEALIINNAVHARAGTPTLPVTRSGLRLAGNVDCSLALCFANAEGLDFSPFPGSLLFGMAASPPSESSPVDDFSGFRRRMPPAIGAVEAPSGPIRPGIKQ
jgi:hypothetical protein